MGSSAGDELSYPADRKTRPRAYSAFPPSHLAGSRGPRFGSRRFREVPLASAGPHAIVAPLRAERGGRLARAVPLRLVAGGSRYDVARSDRALPACVRPVGRRV